MKLADKYRFISKSNLYKIKKEVDDEINRINTILAKNANKGINGCKTKIPYDLLDMVKIKMKEEGYNVKSITFTSKLLDLNRRYSYIEIYPINY